MDLMVNGKTNNGYWRIDNLDEAKVGLDFLANPFALVRTLEDAKKICNIVNEANKIGEDSICTEEL
jgi:hypothetical protein